MCCHQNKFIISRVFPVKRSSKKHSFIRVQALHNGEEKRMLISALTLKMETEAFFSETMLNIYHIMQRHILFTDVTA